MREHHHPNEVIDAFFLDDKDYRGIEYWYNDIVEVIKEMTPKKK